MQIIPSRFILSALLLLFATSAQALPFSFEFGASAATVTNPSPLFEALGKAPSGSASSLFSMPATLALQLQNSQHGLLFAVALQERYLSGKTGAGEDFSVLTLSPMFRVEFWMLVFGVGYSPFAFQNLVLKSAPAVKSSLTLEAQVLFPITNEIDFGLSAARQTFQTDFGRGPDPANQYGAFFRLNFGLSAADSTARQQFKGWRYPLGRPYR
ncbi:MAG: hypothetical protein H7301_10805 [Cryobacterium sp.]|nr:hypothetical protein [Oligoflexia bacterium]